MFTLTAGAFGIFGGITENASASPIPEYTDGYGYNNDTQVMHDTNGFQYSYQVDGIVKLVLPWGYTTHFSFGLTGDYLGVPQIKTALDYEWNWITESEREDTTYEKEMWEPSIYDAELNVTTPGYYYNVAVTDIVGYNYTFTATSDSGNLGWTIAFEFHHDQRMKVTHTIENGYANTLENVKFWYLFDLLGTATPYSIETTLGITEGPLYQEIPDSVYWVRLDNQFQFNWRDALVDYENGYAYVGDGSVIGMDGIPILGISLEIGDIISGYSVEIDPYFSGVERTWNALANGLASNPARWSPVGVPATGDNITFDGTSVFTCNWNVEVTLGQFSMLTGYTGTVTQTVNFGCVDFILEQGTFTGPGGFAGLWLTCEGNFTQTGGSQGSMTLIMNGIETDLSPTAASVFQRLTIDGSITLTETCYAYWEFIVETDATLEIDTGVIMNVNSNSGRTYTNNGEILGDGNLNFYIRDYDRTTTFGEINCGVELDTLAGGTSNSAFIIEENTIFGSWLLVSSADTTYTLELNHSSDYTLDVAGLITLGAKGKINQGTGAWTFGSYLQNGADSVFTQGGPVTVGEFEMTDGTFTGSYTYWLTCEENFTKSGGTIPSTYLSLAMNGETKTISLSSSQSIYRLQINGNISFITANIITIHYSLGIDTDKILTINSASGYITVQGVTIETISNLGTIDGSGNLYFNYYVDRVFGTLGTIECKTTINTVTTSGDKTISLSENTIFDSTLTVRSSHGTYAGELSHGNNYTLLVTGIVTASTRGIMTQGTGAWTFGSYLQNGVSSVFNQGGELSTGDFTISNGEFIANDYDITVSGDWDADGYTHGDNAVFLTGDEKTLDMVDSFCNVTIEAGANYTMDEDTIVDCRATIIGILYGDGDFIEPLPEFTSAPNLNGCPRELYEYEVTQVYWDTLSIHNGPYWMYIVNGEILGVPNDNDTGIYFISLKLSWNDMETYQNYTLIVCGEVLSEVDIFYIMFAFQLILFVIGLIGYFRLPFLLIFTVMATFVVAVPTIIYFGDLYIIAFILIMMNMMVGVRGLLLVRRKRNAV